MSLDDIHEILSWPIAELDTFRLSVKIQVVRIVYSVTSGGVLAVHPEDGRKWGQTIWWLAQRLMKNSDRNSHDGRQYVKAA
jgi:hypothetical protein